MAHPPVTVVIPVGPAPSHVRWFPDCLQSVRAQMVKADEVLIIDDGAYLSQEALGNDVRLWRFPWVSGVAHAVNAGVGLATHPLVIILGSDDILRPWAVADCLREYERRGDDLAFYWMDVKDSPGGPGVMPSGAAMVTKALWEHTGGYPHEGSVGCPAQLFISAMIAAGVAAGRLWRVESQAPPYWHRTHPEQTSQIQRARFQPVIDTIQDIVKGQWVGRFNPP